MRLTNQIRQDILKALLDQRFEKEQNENKRQLDALGEKIYHSIYTPELLGLMAQLPGNSFRRVSNIMARCGRNYRSFNLPKVVELLHFHHQVCVEIPAESELGKEYFDILRKHDELRDNRTEMERKVLTTLNSVTTMHKLLKVWPEVEPFVKGRLFSSPNLPALPTQELNKLLGIPKNESN